MSTATVARPAAGVGRERWLPFFASFALATGVAALVLALAVGHSAATLANGPTDGLDRNVVLVQGAAPSLSGVVASSDTSSLTPGDVSALGNVGYVPDGVAVAPTTGLRAQVSALSRNTQTDVVGTTDAFAGVLGYALAEGRFITAADVQTGTPVVVLGQAVVNSLFAGGDPVGQYVVIDGKNFQVVGTLQARGYSGTYDQDNLVVMPITTAWQSLASLHSDPIDQVLIRADDAPATAAVAREATNTLLERHGIVDPALADFTVVQQPQLVAEGLNTSRATRRLLELASAALLIAGCLHLASLRRRRSATGGTTFDGVAATLSVGLVGAAVGVVLAVLLAPAVHSLVPAVPALHVSVYAMLAGAGLGVAAAAVSLPLAALLDALGGRRHLEGEG